jgi:hypothetical protein
MYCGGRPFGAEFLRVYQGYAKELQAEVNFELIEALHSIEGHDWFRYGKVRARREKELRDPDDVFIQAEQRRRELERQGKKPPRIYAKPGPPRKRRENRGRRG